MTRLSCVFLLLKLFVLMEQNRISLLAPHFYHAGWNWMQSYRCSICFLWNKKRTEARIKKNYFYMMTINNIWGFLHSVVFTARSLQTEASSSASINIWLNLSGGTRFYNTRFAIRDIVMQIRSTSSIRLSKRFHKRLITLWCTICTLPLQVCFHCAGLIMKR